MPFWPLPVAKFCQYALLHMECSLLILVPLLGTYPSDFDTARSFSFFFDLGRSHKEKCMTVPETLPTWGPYALGAVLLLYVFSVLGLAHLCEPLWGDPTADDWEE